MTHEITLNEKYLMKNKQDQKKGNFKNKNLYYIYILKLTNNVTFIIRIISLDLISKILLIIHIFNHNNINMIKN